MRRRFNLDLTDLSRLSVLIHGPYGAGKTYLQGDFLRWARETTNKPVVFLNIKGEDGAASLASLGLGETGETVETLTDYDEALKAYAKDGVQALAVDSLTAFYDLIFAHLLGEVRYPDPKIDGERAKMVWGQARMIAKGRVAASRAAVPWVFWVAPYDRSEDPMMDGSKGTTPDLPGKAAWGCGGWFDFVGLLTAQPGSKPGELVRTVSFVPGAGVLARQRVPHMITKPIRLPHGPGGWAVIYAAMQQALKGGA
jgi:hypothetical protein